jgi:hypothetical protein
LALPILPIGMRLVALVILQSHPLKANIPSSQRDSPVQYQFLRTRHPLYLLLHTNQQLRAPRVILFSSLPSHSLPLPNLLSIPRQSRAGRRRRERGTRWSSRAGRRRWRRTRRGGRGRRARPVDGAGSGALGVQPPSACRRCSEGRPLLRRRPWRPQRVRLRIRGPASSRRRPFPDRRRLEQGSGRWSRRLSSAAGGAGRQQDLGRASHGGAR